MRVEKSMRRRARWWQPRHFGDLGGLVHLRVDKATVAGPGWREAAPSSKGRSCSRWEERGGGRRPNGRGDAMRVGGPEGSG